MSAPILNYLKEKCLDCKGTGHLIEPPYRDQPSYETDYDCVACSGKGWVWALTQDEMAERIANLEAENAALKARNDSLADQLCELNIELLKLEAHVESGEIQ